MNSTPIARPSLGSERLAVYGGALSLSIAAGLMAAYVDFAWVLIAGCLIAALAIVSNRVATLWFVAITALLLVGSAQLYLPGVKYLRFIPPLAASGLLLHVAAHWLSERERDVPATVPAFLLFLFIGLLSMAANWQNAGMAVIGLKSYYPMWSLFLGLALISWRPAVISSLTKAMIAVAVLQFPFVAHQLLVLVPLREMAHVPGVVPVDIIAGTFGGSLYGGGANAVLSLFLITVCACLLGLWRQGAYSGPATAVSITLLLIPVMLNSSKVALLYLPMVFVTIFFTDILRQPLKVLGGLMMTAALVAVMLTSYTMLSPSQNGTTWDGLIEETYQRQLAPERDRADLYSGLSRWTVLTFWAEKHRRMNPVEILIGHGPGATRVQEEGLDLASTLAEKRFGGLQIGYTALAALLWEVGVLGLAAVLLLFWLAFRQAGRLAAFYAPTNRVKSGIAHGLRASVLVLAVSLAHKDFFVFHVPYQTLLMLVLGYLAAETNLMSRVLAHDDPAHRDSLLTQ